MGKGHMHQDNLSYRYACLIISIFSGYIDHQYTVPSQIFLNCGDKNKIVFATTTVLLIMQNHQNNFILLSNEDALINPIKPKHQYQPQY